MAQEKMNDFMKMVRYYAEAEKQLLVLQLLVLML